MRPLLSAALFLLLLPLIHTAALANDSAMEYGGMKIDKKTVIKTSRSINDGIPLHGEVTELRSNVQDINAAISDLGGTIDGNLLILKLSADVLFDFDKAEIKPAAEQSLQKVALIIAKKAKGPVRIIGHTDSRGSEEYNQDLSLRRAAATKRWLINQGGTNAKYQVECGFLWKIKKKGILVFLII